MNAPAQTPRNPHASFAAMLEPLQVQAAHLLAAGQGYSQVSQTLGIGRATLYRWRQQPDFAAYLHQLLRQAADQATARSTHLLELAQDLLQQQLQDPATPLQLRLQLALRITALYSKPQHLRYLQSLPEDPQLVAESQARQAAVLSGLDPDELDGSDIELYQGFQFDRLQHAQAFDSRYPNPEALLATPARARAGMNQNETAPPSARPAAPLHPACTRAMDAALFATRSQILQSTT